jgi:NAD(P)H-dependent FMN reductase
MSAVPKIGIVISTTREGRFSEKPAQWIQAIASARGDMAVELVDLRDWPLPFFDEVKSPAWGVPENEVAKRWSEKLISLDGFIFVTAEYNRAPPAVLKNALDYAYREFNRKPAAYVGFGPLGAARAVEQLRLINVELQMAPLRSGVHIAGSDFFAVFRGEASLNDFPHLTQSANTMLDELSWWAKALHLARSAAESEAMAA